MRAPLVLRGAGAALALALWGSAAPAADTAIYTLQGSGAVSPYAGQAVTTTGVVTRLNSNGFFIQDLAGDGDPATSDGLFVFSTVHAPAVGSLVRVAGTLVEFNTGAAGNPETSTRPLTEITSVSAVTVLGTGYTLAPLTVTLPLPEGVTFERYEGMLVRLPDTLTVQQNYFQARYGQLTLGAGGRHETPTNRHRPNSPQAVALADLQARSRLLLDDGSTQQNRNPTPYVGSGGAPRAGDTVAGVTGVIDFGLATASNAGLALYRIHPTAAPLFNVANPRPAQPPAVGGNVRLAAMNVLNYFTTFTDGATADGQTGQGCTLGGSSTTPGNCRGADGLAEFVRQQAKIVRALAALDADAVGLIEIQNNGGVAVQNLVDALNAVVGAGTYAAVADAPQGSGSDAIKVAMIHKPARLARVGASVSDPAAVNNRPPLAQTFAAANGERVTLVVNHLKSKGSCPAATDADAPGNVDAGDGQGCWNALRLRQAQALRSFVARLQAAGGTNDVLLLGDFNAYAQEDPIADLTTSGYVDEIGRYSAFGYSYVFDGTAGRLDHVIATASLSARISGAADWHIDADESLAQDYNLEFKQPACATCAPDPYDGNGPYRASDHDPALVGVNLYKAVAGTAGRDTLNGSPGDDLIEGGAGADMLRGGEGADIFVYAGLRDAGDVIADFTPGVDRIDLRGLWPGYRGSDAVADGWVRFVAGGKGTVVEVDVDGPAGGAVFRPLLTLAGVSPTSLVAARDLIVR